MRKTICLLVVLIIASTAVVQAQTSCGCESQVLPETLAIVNGVTITSKDINKNIGEAVGQLQRQVIEARKHELDLLVNSKLLEAEAQKRGMSTTKLLEQEVAAKVQRPTPAEVRTFYDQNQARIKEDFEDVSGDILNYLLDQRQRLEAKRFADGLREASETKVLVTNVTPPANEAERARVFATVKGEPITSGDLEDSLRPLIFNFQEQVYKLRKGELDLTINDTLLTAEAQKRKVTTTALLDAEVKPKAVTDEQARAFYDQNKDRISGDFAEAKDAIRKYLEQVEVRQAERAFLDKLRAAASIQVFLVAPESLNRSPQESTKGPKN